MADTDTKTESYATTTQRDFARERSEEKQDDIERLAAEHPLLANVVVEQALTIERWTKTAETARLKIRDLEEGITFRASTIGKLEDQLKQKTQDGDTLAAYAEKLEEDIKALEKKLTAARKRAKRASGKKATK